MTQPIGSDPEILIVKAYARLKGLRENVPDDTYAPTVMVDDFNLALDDLRRAGYDLSDFRIHPVHMDDTYGVPRTQASLLCARIDAVLIYFRIDRDPEDEGPVKARIGFEAPKP